MNTKANQNVGLMRPLNEMTKEPTMKILALVLGLALCSCKLPVVNLGTPEPIKVDVNVRLNVYQYKGEEPAAPNAEEKSYEEAVERQRNRMSEVQQLKDNRFVGEDHRSLLHLRTKPAGDWGNYVEKTVKEENEDRMILMRRAAKDSNRALHEVQDEQWKLRADKAFKGEWIEVPGDKPDTFKWAQSSGPAPKTATKESPKDAAQETKSEAADAEPKKP